MFLRKILKSKREALEKAKVVTPIESLLASLDENRRNSFFKKKLAEREKISLIAEVKKASPSKGIICNDFDPVKLVVEYEKAGADAISVLTETEYFLGDLSYLKLARNLTDIPLLRKDFILDEYQLVEAAVHGADAVLLIVAALEKKELSYLINKADEYKLDVLVEVHDADQLNIALTSGATLIGINNRDLRSFHVALSVTEKLIKIVPDGIIVVSESGIRTQEDVAKLESMGVNAILVGETLLRSDNVVAEIHELMGNSIKNGFTENRI
ncbi:MAG: indole-3-glycerol phosphate synthase TrpC [Candidatus Theseobacter exili]|nr:indole-3-glycerol phosphate synthase TrpC [Candidatus Theseobacter exili]